MSQLQQRAAEGMLKYGVPMTRTDLTPLQWVQHALEEAMDLALYLERLKRDIVQMQDEIQSSNEYIQKLDQTEEYYRDYQRRYEEAYREIEEAL